MVRFRFPKAFKVFLVLLLVFWAGPAQAVPDREHKTLTLNNNLDVWLIHDPEVHRSATALSVGVGQLYDPEDRPGLAHYLEHMLFLGTEKYPDVEDFKKYLNENSGGSNAYTGAAVTNYFFEVSHAGFEGALDRFSQFFKAPLFNKKYAEREIHAVNSEHDKNKRNDHWRAGYVVNLVAEEGHPISNFGTGNLETLKGTRRERLLDFHEKYYAARNMKLVILSHLPLSAQEKLAREYFEDIPDHPVKHPDIDPAYRKPLENQYRFLKIKMIKDLRSLDLEFPTIRLKDHQASKPASVVGSVIGHEGKGSLLSQLKKEGLALGLSAGGGYSHPNLNSFNISISLTAQGVKHHQQVLERVFAYIEMLRNHGIEKYTYDENAAMAEINFKWKDPDEGMGFAASRAALMQDYELDEVRTLPFLYKKYEPEAYRALIQTLKPENALVTLKTNSVETQREANYYGTEYALTRVGVPAFQKLKTPPKIAAIHYPDKNEFIPYDLERVDELPHLVWNQDLGKVWFLFDNRFEQPRVFMQFLIETPRVYDTVRHVKLAHLYNAVLKEQLNEMVYPIQLAGLSYSLSVEKKGVVLSIGGYNARLKDLLKLVAGNLTRINIQPQKFENLKEAMIRGLKNRKYAQAYARGGYYNRLLWLRKQYTEEEQLEALKPLTLQDVKAYSQKLFDRVYITGMAHGNWNDEDVQESLQILLDALNSKPLPQEDRFEQVVEQLEPGQEILFTQKIRDNNNSIAYGLQVGERNFDLQARMSLIASIVESDFYTRMRTQQQLGYIVWSFQQRLEDSIFFRMIIQSANHSPFELKKRIDAWLQKTDKLFSQLSDEEFERHRKSRIISLEKKGESIAEVMGEYYYLVTEEDADFLYKEKLIQAVKDLTKEEVVQTARNILNNSQTPRLVILIRSQENDDPVPEGVLTQVREFKNRVATTAKRRVLTEEGS